MRPKYSGFESAVILAGGMSTRMGFDKQLLQIHGRRIAWHLIALLGERFPDIMVSSPTPELYSATAVRVIPDIHKSVGPLGGIHAALVNAKSEAVFVVACDMPFLVVPYIDYMMALLAGSDYDACVTARGEHLETMHAFYCRSALPVLEAELAQNRYSLQRLARKVNALIIPEQKAATYVPDWLAFTNLNTPEEYAQFKSAQAVNNGNSP